MDGVWRCWLLVALGAGVAGCYLSHGRGEGDGAAGGGDGALRDAGAIDGRTPTGMDAGPSSARDAAPDGPLPIEPEPDPGPDGRPSDDPSAAGWTDPDPSAFPPDEPGAVPVGDAITLPFDVVGEAQSIDLEWDGRRWGMVYITHTSTFFVNLAPLGARDGEPRDLGLGRQYTARLVWAGGRFLVVVASDDLVATTTVGFLDETGARASEWTVVPSANRAVGARFVHSNRWLLAWLDHPARQVVERELATDGSWLGEPVTVATGMSENHVLAAVGLKSRSVVFEVALDAIRANVARVPLADDARTSYPVLAAPHVADFGVGAGRFRDWAVVASGAGDPTMALLVGAINPWEPSATMTTSVSIDARGFGASAVASDDGTGVIAVCTPVLPPTSMGDGPTEIQVRLFGPHLEPLGAPATVGEIYGWPVQSQACDIAFSPAGILVAWWGPNRDVTGVTVRPLAVAASRR